MNPVWMILAMASVITALNVGIGYRWTRLDHNPWTGKFLGGTFHTPAPGLNPGALTVEEIRQRGRTLMVAAPTIFVVALFIVALRLLIVGNL